MLALQEAIALSDASVSLVETYAKDTGLLTVVPGSLFVDGAAGKVIKIVISAAFLVSSAVMRNGTVGEVGYNIPISTILGQNNLPGLFVGGNLNTLEPPPIGRRLLCSTRLAAAIGAACPAAEPAPEPLRRRLLPAAEVEALTGAGMWPALAALLPPELVPRLAAALASLPHTPLGENVEATSAAVSAAAAALGLDDAATVAALRNFTLAAPQAPTSLLATSFVPLFDIELTSRLLLQENENGASVRAGPTFRVGGDGTIAAGYLLQPLFTTFIATTKAQLASFAAGKLRAAASAIAGNATAAAQQSQSNAEELARFFNMQLGPLPTAVAVAFDFVIRSQLSINGGDIASVL